MPLTVRSVPRLSWTWGLLAPVLLLAGCFKADIDLTIRSDETVDGTLLLAYERAALERMDRTEADAQAELLTDLADDAPAGLSCGAYEDDAFIGAECTVQGVPLEELNQAEALNQRLTILSVSDQLVLSSVVDLTGMPEGDRGSFDVTIRVAFPGEVLEESNGDVSGTSVTWRPEPGQRMVLRAVAEIPTLTPAELQRQPLWVFGAVALVAFLAGVGVVLALRRLRHT